MEPDTFRKIVDSFVALIVAFIACALISLLCSCRSTKTIEYRDSIRTEVRYEKVYVKDTAYIEIEKEAKEVLIRDSVSYLENDYAWSKARVYSDGMLFHSLETKSGSLPVEIEKEIEYRDSVIYKEKVKTEIKEVEKKLNWWQKICVNGFPWLLGIVGLYFLYRFKKVF